MSDFPSGEGVHHTCSNLNVNGRPVKAGPLEGKHVDAWMHQSYRSSTTHFSLLVRHSFILFSPTVNNHCHYHYQINGQNLGSKAAIIKQLRMRCSHRLDKFFESRIFSQGNDRNLAKLFTKLAGSKESAFQLSAAWKLGWFHIEWLMWKPRNTSGNVLFLGSFFFMLKVVSQKYQQRQKKKPLIQY